MLRPWWQVDLDWRTERSAILAAYPGADFEFHYGRGVWHVPMCPVPEPYEYGLVMSDLEKEHPVRVLVRGQLAHTVNCERSAGEHTFSACGAPVRRTYVASLELPTAPRGSGGDVHPRARIHSVMPLPLSGSDSITVGSYPDHPHLSFGDGGDSWACPLSPHETSWGWRTGAIVEYLDYVSIWLAKTELWIRTKQWVGPSVSHAFEDTVRIPSVAPCRCGSGRLYGVCHQPRDRDENVAVAPSPWGVGAGARL